MVLLVTVLSAMVIYFDGIFAAHCLVAAVDVCLFDELCYWVVVLLFIWGFWVVLVRDGVDCLVVISEIKWRLLLKGDLNVGFDLVVLVVIYEGVGVFCLFVFIDEVYFGGSVVDLWVVWGVMVLFVICKDFIVFERDVCDVCLMGVDCVLLIAAVLD